MFEDPEERKNRKIRKIARGGAYALGGGAGCWFMGMIYPHEQSANTVASVFNSVGMLLIVYGVLTLLSVIFKRKFAIPVHIVLTWLLVPAALIYIFATYWNGPALAITSP